MNLQEKIMAIYPELTFRDFLTYIIVRNDLDERGEYLDKWDHPTLTRPTEDQLK